MAARALTVLVLGVGLIAGCGEAEAPAPPPVPKMTTVRVGALVPWEGSTMLYTCLGEGQQIAVCGPVKATYPGVEQIVTVPVGTKVRVQLNVNYPAEAVQLGMSGAGSCWITDATGKMTLAKADISLTRQTFCETTAQ